MAYVMIGMNRKRLPRHLTARNELLPWGVARLFIYTPSLPRLASFLGCSVNSAASAWANETTFRPSSRRASLTSTMLQTQQPCFPAVGQLTMHGPSPARQARFSPPQRLRNAAKRPSLGFLKVLASSLQWSGDGHQRLGLTKISPTHTI